ncbi:alpha-amylase family glycosyl hydrolase [Pseudoduganella sp. OTU4001]|uniref:alpha-amylase family glycosyl hydrolase n=1 Tax=Pseudoduganella sp. OTU4001 TaxID=3043854 RepID=UPI00313B7D7E
MLPTATPAGVRFVFDAAPDARTVALAGTFNSWVGDACMMERVTPTRWQVTLPIAAGRHLYKIVVDGTEWLRDPANPWISEDGQNNSCLTVDETGAVLLRHPGLSAATPGPLYARPALASPGWLHDAAIYQLSVKAFGGDFDGVRAKLGYLSELGVNTLWIMPVQPIGISGRRGTHGDPYAVRDFLAIDPALGDEQGLRALVDAAHARGMRVLFDWTLNRASVDNPLTQTHPEWFTRRADGSIYYAVPNRDYFAGFDFSNAELRRYLIDAMAGWIERFGFDGLRFDDSDITPLDFLEQIRAALLKVQPELAIISQAYDEFHHFASCDLTYEGGTRAILLAIARGEASGADLARYWSESTYSFPRGALRLRWLDEKEQPRASSLLGAALRPAAAVLLALDGVPHLMMGQEFGEPSWRDWTVLFDDYRIDWSAFDASIYAHYQRLLALRREHPALRRGEVAFLDGLPPGVVGFTRSTAQESVLLLANLSSGAATLPPSVFAQYTAGAAAGWDAAAGTLAAHGWMICLQH